MPILAGVSSAAWALTKPPASIKPTTTGTRPLCAARSQRAPSGVVREYLRHGLERVRVAAQEGVTPGREAVYRERRRWFISHYGHVKPEVSRFLQADASDSAPSLWGHRSCDAFEALFLPGSIGAVLSADGGNLIGRLIRTQTALAAWEETLHRADEVSSTHY